VRATGPSLPCPRCCAIVTTPWCTSDHRGLFEKPLGCLENLRDTVGELKSAENFASHMPCWKAKKLGEAYSRNLSLGASK
jgi:hypothetical protein